MLNIDKMQPTQRLYIPRNGHALGASCGLVFTSTTENVPVEVHVTEASVVGRYFLLVVGLPEGMHAGEWRYEFTTGDALASCGLAQVSGEGEVRFLQYNEGKKQTYQEYGN